MIIIWVEITMDIESVRANSAFSGQNQGRQKTDNSPVVAIFWTITIGIQGDKHRIDISVTIGAHISGLISLLKSSVRFNTIRGDFGIIVEWLVRSCYGIVH